MLSWGKNGSRVLWMEDICTHRDGSLTPRPETQQEGNSIRICFHDNNKKHHIHSKLIGEFLPTPASSVSFSLDLNHVFIFPI